MIIEDHVGRKIFQQSHTFHYNKLINYAATSKQIAKMQESKLLEPELLDNKKIIHHEYEDDNITNLYRELRTKLLQNNNSTNFVAMVTGANLNSGSSHIAVNLASSFAFDPTKTSMVIDCNLVKPTLHKIFDLEPEYGLTDYLENDEIKLEEIIYQTGIKRLRLIPVGERRESSTEHFTSFKIRLFMDAIKARYPDRFIFLDSPPIGQSADAQILSELCDFIILVVPYGQITEARLSKVVKTIDANKFAGVIFNG